MKIILLSNQGIWGLLTLAYQNKTLEMLNCLYLITAWDKTLEKMEYFLLFTNDFFLL